MANPASESCPGCGITLPVIAGAVHRYIGASPSCWAIYTALSSAGEPPLAPGPLNELLVDAYISTYGNDPENRLLFYFSGHGHTVQPSYGGEPIGYIVPKDAPDPKENPEQFKRMAMSMQRIEEYARTIDAKHALFLFDSCFSGSLFALSRAIPEDISYKSARPVRQFITSGGEDEQVPDKSIFRQQFISALRGEADANSDSYITGTLGNYLQTSVINYSKGYQHPQYGKMRDPNLDKGDFVFAPGQGAPEAVGSAKGNNLPGQFRNKTAMTATETDQLVQDLAARYKKSDILPPEKEDEWTRKRNTTLVFLDIEGEGTAKGERNFILDSVSEQLRARGRYTLVEREIVDKLVAELRLSNSDLADPATALKLGRILSAGLIATGHEQPETGMADQPALPRYGNHQNQDLGFNPKTLRVRLPKH